MQSIEEQVLAAIQARLAESGWVRPDGHAELFVKSMSSDIHCQIWLDMSVDSDGSLLIWPTVSVRHSEIGRLEQRFLESPESPHLATIGCSLDTLLHDHGRVVEDEWVVRSLSDIDRASAAVCADLEAYGIPFLESFATLDDVVAYLGEGSGPDDRDRKLAIGCILLGRESETKAVLRRLAARAHEHGPLVAVQTQRFLSSFLRHFRIDQTIADYGFEP